MKSDFSTITQQHLHRKNYDTFNAIQQSFTISRSRLQYADVDLAKDSTVAQIAERLKVTQGETRLGEGAAGATEGTEAPSRSRVVKVAGMWGSFARLLAAFLSNNLNRPILLICPHIDDADNAVDDLQTFCEGDVEGLPAWEGEEDIADATDEIRAQRLKVVARLSPRLFRLCSRQFGSGQASLVPRQLIITSSVQAICQPIPKPDALAKSALQLQIRKTVSPQQAAEWLVTNGFECVDKVDLPGQFARRGGIIDIYAPLFHGASGSSQAIRVEFFGDIIESIREIDLDTQRSTAEIENISIVSAVCGSALQDRELFLNILPEDAIVILEEPADCEEVAKVYFERVEQKDRLYSWLDIYNALARQSQLHISRFPAGDPAEYLKVNVRSIQQYQHKAASLWAGHKESLDELVAEAKQGKTILLYCEAEAEITRVAEIIKQEHTDIPPRLKMFKGFIHQGFAIDSLNTIVISHHELFGQFALRRRQRPVRAVAPIDTLEDLQEGDYVVHAAYGIGRFRGIETITEKGSPNEYLTIEYDGGVKAQVSVRNIALVQKYIGTSPRHPKLSKIGSKKWQKQKEKVAKSVKDLAAELLEIQAKRQALGGFAFKPDSNWQVEFEQSFPYQETPDQTTVAAQIKNDMQQPAAMDRLLCGDVGYGKTELAMRAAFKVVENGKQVAVLVPTTVLCVQHGRTFTERFADFPVVVEVLNRFKSTKEAKDIIARTKTGKVDVLIGTHRLLSRDVAFKDLGLVIIDEEQRFGVEHKEKLKKLRVNVDVLTMTATPIPRTLHMSMLGLRDISSLATAPLDRRSIVTAVAPYNEELIRRAIIRELNRQGQVFLVHNRVKTIEQKAWEVQKLIPDAKVAIAHGQMAKTELEKAMIDFVLGETDVLVCTTIIESGLDIPNANTMIINDADRFGLAEMHQLRGRVGRYKHRAFAYMLLPVSRPVTPIAARRLKAIEEYSHLGAGFRIALRDLEIRGAGNILGAEQSGHIQLVGYQMYCELLANAVREIKGEPIEAIPTAAIDPGFAAFIPKSYIPADRSRLDAYRRLAVTKTKDELHQLAGELADVYGPIPDEVKLLLELAQFRIAASKLDIKSIVAHAGNLVFSFSDDAAKRAKNLFRNISGKWTIGDESTVYLHLQESYFEQQTLIPLLRKILGGKKQ
jgi:transcription-repair coupling factor (superfamily II helicase)